MNEYTSGAKHRDIDREISERNERDQTSVEKAKKILEALELALNLLKKDPIVQAYLELTLSVTKLGTQLHIRKPLETLEAHHSVVVYITVYREFLYAQNTLRLAEEKK